MRVDERSSDEKEARSKFRRAPLRCGLKHEELARVRGSKLHACRRLRRMAGETATAGLRGERQSLGSAKATAKPRHTLDVANDVDPP